jgi:hypothetical protein
MRPPATPHVFVVHQNRHVTLLIGAAIAAVIIPYFDHEALKVNDAKPLPCAKLWNKRVLRSIMRLWWQFPEMGRSPQEIKELRLSQERLDY